MSDLKHLRTAWDVDRNIVLESERLVVVRFSQNESRRAGGSTSDNSQQQVFEQHYTATAYVDDILTSVAVRTRKYAVVYAVDCLHDVTEFNTMYELDGDDPFAIMFFFRGKHIRVDVGTGNHNKINFVVEEDDLIPILDAAYRAGRQGKEICSSEKKFSYANVVRR